VTAAQNEAKAKTIAANAAAAAKRIQDQAENHSKLSAQEARTKIMEKEEEAFRNKLQLLRARLEKKTKAQRQKLDLRATKEGGVKVLRQKEHTHKRKERIAKHEQDMEFKGKMRVQKRKAREEQNEKAAVKEKRKKKIWHMQLELARAKESANKKNGWIRERGLKQPMKMKRRVKARIMRAKERGQKAYEQMKNPADQVLRHQERQGSRHVRAVTHRLTKKMRDTFRLRQFDLRHTRKVEMKDIKREEKLAADVMKNYADRYNIKRPPTLHFKHLNKDYEKELYGSANDAISGSKKAAKKKGVGPDTKFLPVALATKEMVRDTRSAFRNSEARRTADEAVKEAMQSLSTKAHHRNDY
jgi:hypothetical protein